MMMIFSFAIGCVYNNEKEQLVFIWDMTDTCKIDQGMCLID